MKELTPEQRNDLLLQAKGCYLNNKMQLHDLQPIFAEEFNRADIAEKLQKIIGDLNLLFFEIEQIEV